MTGNLQIGARRASMDIGVQVVGRIASLMLGVVVTVALVRTLGAAGFGQWSTILAVTQIAANFGELGLVQTAISRAASHQDQAGKWLGALVSLRLILALPVTLLSIGAVLLVAPTAQSRLAGVIISCTLLIGAPGALGAAFQLRVRNDISTAILTMNSILWLVAVLVAAAMSSNIVTFALLFLAVTARTTLVSVVLALRVLPVSFRHTRHLWGDLVRVGVTVGVAGILITAYVKLDQILVLDLAGSHQAGLYGAAYRILDQAQFIPASVMTTLFPLIAQAYPLDMTRVRALLQLAAEYLTMGSLPILAFTIVAARPIMALLFGYQFLAAAPALPVLMGAFVLISLGYVTGSMVVLLSLQRRFIIYAASALVLNAGLNFALIPIYGFLAAAWITLITEALVIVLAARAITGALSMRPRLGRLLRTLAAAVLMGGVTWVAKELGAPFGVLIGVSAVTYVTAIASLRVLSLAEIRAVLRKEPIAP